MDKIQKNTMRGRKKSENEFRKKNSTKQKRQQKDTSLIWVSGYEDTDVDKYMLYTLYMYAFKNI